MKYYHRATLAKFWNRMTLFNLLFRICAILVWVCMAFFADNLNTTWGTFPIGMAAFIACCFFLGWL